MLPVAQHIQQLSGQLWGPEHASVIVGQHPTLQSTLERLSRFAVTDRPILVTGETGVGKALFARGAAALSMANRRLPFLTVNCAQYGQEPLSNGFLSDPQPTSRTDEADFHQLFERADGGIVFLDEVGELGAAGQAMLLRILNDSEWMPLDQHSGRKVRVRLIASTHRDLARLVMEGRFREDLYYRLRCLVLDVPSLRARGDDWRLLAQFYLDGLQTRHGADREYGEKWLAPETISMLQSHRWPGNVRELRNLMEVGYHLSTTDLITPNDLGFALEEMTRRSELRRIPSSWAEEICEQMTTRRSTFWQAIHRPYLERELNRSEVREVISYALAYVSQGSYKRMLTSFGVADEDYLKAMDFLRHHKLKPKK